MKSVLNSMKMKKITYFTAIFFLCLFGCSNREKMFTSNPQLIAEIDKYLSFIDTSDLYSPDCSYIYLRVNNRGKDDTIDVILSVSTGAYGIVNPRDTIIDFFQYRNYNVLLLGDYPNKLIAINRKLNKDIKKEILIKYFKKEYMLYLKDPFSLKPKPADHMFMTLVFKDTVMVSATER